MQGGWLQSGGKAVECWIGEQFDGSTAGWFDRGTSQLPNTLRSHSAGSERPTQSLTLSWTNAYLERDARTISNIGDLAAFQRFTQLCAGRTGQLLSLSSLASDCGVSQPTAKAWLSVLEASFIAFRLPSYHGNVSKRLIKMPKLHFYDSGLACWLLGIRDAGQLAAHPLRGAMFESWVVSEIIKSRCNHGESDGVFFFRDKAGVESDALVESGGGITLVEAKSGQTISSDMAEGIERIATLFARRKKTAASLVIYGGTERQLRSSVTYLPWQQIQAQLWAGKQ
jgi:predicted AAA+ superfamily ATPase